MTVSTFKWQGSVDSTAGTAAFFPGTHRQVVARFDTFKEANDLAMAINGAIKDAKHMGWVALRSKIERMEP